MMGKVITGKSFGGCIRYTVQKQDAEILDAQGVRTGEVNHIIHDFNLQRKYNPDLGQAVGHIALSWSSNDADKLSDETMITIAKEYLKQMKVQDTQYLIVKHKDRNHPHIHIVYNRVNNEGKTIPDSFQKQRNAKVCKELTLKHGFYLAENKNEVNRKQLKGEDKVKYELFDAIKAASQRVNSMDDLKLLLTKQHITLQYKYRSGTKEVQGISFSKGEYKFKGSEIDRSLSYAKLSQAIAQRVKETTTQQAQKQPSKEWPQQSLKSIVEQLRQQQYEQWASQQPANQYQRQEQNIPIQPQTSSQETAPLSGYMNEALSAGSDLLEGLLSSMGDDDNTPEEKRKRRMENEQNQGMSR